MGTFTIYNSDLLPWDFHGFVQMKEALAKETFVNGEGVKHAVRKWLTEVERDFSVVDFEKLVSRYDKCLNRLGNYIRNREICVIS